MITSTGPAATMRSCCVAGRSARRRVLIRKQWRAEIRAKARADKIRVMTIRSGDRAIAALRRTVPKDQEFAVLSAAMQRGEVLRGAAERARLLGHEIVRWVAHDQESIAMCPRCQARIYVRLDSDPPVVDGEALERDLPRLTAVHVWLRGFRGTRAACRRACIGRAGCRSGRSCRSLPV